MNPNKPDQPDEPEILTPVEARQGRLGRDVLYVLFISLSLAIVAAVVLLTWASPRTPDADKAGMFLSPLSSSVIASKMPGSGMAFAHGHLARQA